MVMSTRLRMLQPDIMSVKNVGMMIRIILNSFPRERSTMNRVTHRHEERSDLDPSLREAGEMCSQGGL